jgi:hypothetical protein
MKKLCLVLCFILASYGSILSQTGTIKDVKPSGGYLFKNLPSSITWIAQGTKGAFRVTLWRNGVRIGLIAKNVTPTHGKRSIPWQVGTFIGGSAPLGTGYQIKVKEIGQPAAAMSKAAFEIRKMPSFQLKLPKMEQMLNIPLGALKYGSQVLINGENFGTNKGNILLYGNFPNSPLSFENVEWVSTSRVRGYVPQAANGSPNQTVTIKVKTAGNILSNGMTTGFIGRETKYLVWSDVGVLHCGDDANKNYCNDPQGYFQPHRVQETAMFGFHQNAWATIGDDEGHDIFQIILNNGWILKSMDIVIWEKSSSDEVLNGPHPPFPAGTTNWTPTIDWVASPFDHVRYQIKIVVEGPAGTHYK